MKCNNCGNEIGENDLFCVKCGTKVEKEKTQEGTNETKQPEVLETVTTPNELVTPIVSATPIEPETQNIPETPIVPATPVSPVIPTQPVMPVANQFQNMPGNMNYNQGAMQGMPMVKPIKKKKGGLVFGIIAGIVLILAVLAFVFLLPKNEKVDNSKLFYVEDNELFLADLKKTNFDAISLNDEYQDSSQYWPDYGFGTGNISVSSDGKTYYFPTQIDDNYCYNLCAATIKKGKAVVEKIDSNVSSYQLLKDDTILYSKYDKLYYYDGKNKTKVASSVGYFILSEDQKNLLWTEDESLNEDTYEYKVNIYYQPMSFKVDSVCIKKDVKYIGNSDDLQVIYFIDNDDLYVSDVKGNKEKLVSDCSDAYLTDIKNNKFYYTVSTSEKKSAMDYVIDDYAESDAAITEPMPEEFEVEVYDDFWGYTYTDTDWDAYYNAYDIYQEKYNRDMLREELLAYDITTSVDDLYYYDGKKSELVTEDFYYFYVYPTDENFVCAVMQPSNVAAIPITDIYSAYDVEYQIGYGDIKALVSCNGKTETVEEDRLDSFWQGDGQLYFTTANENSEYELYTYTLNSFDLSASKFGETTELSDEMNSFEGILDGKPYYICNADYDTSEGDLFCDTDEIASDVRMWSVGFFQDEDALCYSTNLDSDGESMTLMVYKNGKESEIGDDISYFSALNSSYFVFLQDFDFTDAYGELMLNDKGNVEKIASDVTLFAPFSGGLSGSMYGNW